MQIILLFTVFILAFGLRGRIKRLEDIVKKQESMIMAMGKKLNIFPEPMTTEDKTAMQPQASAKAMPQNYAGKTGSNPVKKSAVSEPENHFEFQIGAKLPVWIGGVALIAGVFFLVKYSIENSFISPEFRLILGGMFGAALLTASEYARRKIADKVPMPIRQSIAGAGIAILYIVSYSAYGIYHFLGSSTAFGALTIVTGTAIVFSIRMGMPIAVMGLLGGFVTPLLLESAAPNPILLFTYIYLLYSGILFVIRKMRWPALTLPATLGAVIWVFLWFAGNHFHTMDAIVLGLFLAAISLTHAFFTPVEEKENTDIFDDITPRQISILASSSGALALFALIIGQNGIALFEWGMYSLLCTACLVLAFFKPKEYALAPVIATVVTALLLISWQGAALIQLVTVSAIMAGILSFCCFYFAWRYRRFSFFYGCVAAITPLAYFLIDFAKYKIDRSLDGTQSDILRITSHVPDDVFEATSVLDLHDTVWGGVAILLGAIMVGIAAKIPPLWPDNKTMKNNLLAIFSVSATAFITAGLCISLEHEMLAVALAIETVFLAWIYSRLHAPWLRWLTAAVALGFAVVIAHQLLLLVFLTLKAVFGYTGTVSMPLSRMPILQSGIPALLFALAGLFLYRRKDDRIVQLMEAFFIGLITLCAYYSVRLLFYPDIETIFYRVGFIERGIITNIFLAFAVASFWFGRQYHRRVFEIVGIGLTCAGLFRIGWFDIVLHNSWMVPQTAGSWPIINGFTLTFGLPLIALCIQGRQFMTYGYRRLCHWVSVSCLLLVFALVTFWVRHLFHMETGMSYRIGDAEMYSYSAVWLLLGVALLFGGVIQRNSAMRYGSLAVLILTVAKVFFFDAAALDGLYRVFSFFGLGFVLIGLSYIYTQYVFKTEKQL